MNIYKRPATISLAVVFLMGAILSVAPQKISATEAGPNGANVGFDFSWDDSANPAGHSASFLESDGITANNCSGGTLNAITKTCNFVFDYRVNGNVEASTSHAARWITWSNPASYVNGKPTGTGCSSPTSGSGDLGKAPLTLFDCFNSGSLGQVFRPKTTGPLNQFRMSMTCLTPSGTSPYELYALLYELNPEGTTLTGNSPLGATLVNLTKCPTTSTWKNKTFKAADFAMMPMSFNNAQVTAGKFYGVYFTGIGMPGTLPPGASVAISAAKAATTTTTLPPVTTTTTPWSNFKSEKNKTSATAPTTSTAPATTRAPAELTALGATRFNLSAVRLMTAAMSTKYYVSSLTPKVCLGAGRNIVFVRTGRCNAKVLFRSNGKLFGSVSTRVVSGTTENTDEVVALAPATNIYFKSGTGFATTASKQEMNKIIPLAKTADAILVTGHTGNLQSENTDLVQLSQKRARAVRSLLRDRGIRKSITIWSYGATSSVSAEKTEAAQNLNRRAEIFVIP
jgi:flagellar motor protein MotB